MIIYVMPCNHDTLIDNIFQDKYVKPQYIKSNNKVYQLFQVEENKYSMSQRVPLITVGPEAFHSSFDDD